MDLKSLIEPEHCPCGREHKAPIDQVIIEKGAIRQLPRCIAQYGKKPFILADVNTYEAAGRAVCSILEENKIAYTKYIFSETRLEPDEQAVGSAVMHYDHTCDVIVAVGSGVINDIGKILANVAGCAYIIVGTAPSMDGYASATSSMAMDGLKVTLPSKCANVIIGDIDILSQAPEKMLRSGLGDMLAKYVSICEWRIGHILTGEYYCENVAQLIRSALKKCVDNAEKLLERDEAAVAAVFEGLVIGGIAMAYAGVSRPASGVEHYFSHIWDMRGLEFGTQVDLHGIQCAVGTYLTIQLYEQIRKENPDPEKACAYVQAFDYGKWSSELRCFLGKSAEAMIALEGKEQKYCVKKHAERFGMIQENWEKLVKIMEEELPDAARLEAVYEVTGIPKLPEEIGIDPDIIPMSFKATKDMRDKYVLSRLAWDLGVLEELAASLESKAVTSGENMGTAASDSRRVCGQNKEAVEKTILVEGHRGYCAKYPENTMISFEAALDLGVDAFEFDVWLTGDKVPVLMHDGNAKRTCGVDRWLRDMTLEEVKQLEPAYREKFQDTYTGQGITVPTLEEMLKMCAVKRPDLILGVEIKEYTEETVDLTVALLKQYGFFDNCYFYAFNGRIIKYIKTKYNGRTMGYPDFQMGEFEKDTYDYYDEIGLSMGIVKSEMGHVYMGKGFPMHLYCADNEADVELCIEKGAALITANDPIALMKRLGRLSR